MKKTTTSNPLKFFNDNKSMAYKKAGGEMDAFKKSLKRMDNGGGSGMGRMAADDAAFDAMMNQPTSSPTTSPYPSPESARLLAAQAAKDAAMTMQGANTVSNTNSYNIDAANSKLIPTFSKSPYNRDAMEILERRTQLNNRKKTSGEKKKGGSIGRKK